MQSRYYDPELGRFLNADSYASTGQGVLGNNMFVYCNNEPTFNIDINGFFPTRAQPAVIMIQDAGTNQRTFADYINSIVPPEVKEREEKIWRVIDHTLDSAFRGALGNVDGELFICIIPLIKGTKCISASTLLTVSGAGFLLDAIHGFLEAMQEEFGWP